jgi:hypothetical protein
MSLRLSHPHHSGPRYRQVEAQLSSRSTRGLCMVEDFTVHVYSDTRCHNPQLGQILGVRRRLCCQILKLLVLCYVTWSHVIRCVIRYHFKLDFIE